MTARQGREHMKPGSDVHRWLGAPTGPHRRVLAGLLAGLLLGALLLLVGCRNDADEPAQTETKTGAKAQKPAPAPPPSQTTTAPAPPAPRGAAMAGESHTGKVIDVLHGDRIVVDWGDGRETIRVHGVSVPGYGEGFVLAAECATWVLAHPGSSVEVAITGADSDRRTTARLFPAKDAPSVGAILLAAGFALFDSGEFGSDEFSRDAAKRAADQKLGLHSPAAMKPGWQPPSAPEIARACVEAARYLLNEWPASSPPVPMGGSTLAVGPEQLFALMRDRAAQSVTPLNASDARRQKLADEDQERRRQARWREKTGEPPPESELPPVRPRVGGGTGAAQPPAAPGVGPGEGPSGAPSTWRCENCDVETTVSSSGAGGLQTCRKCGAPMKEVR